MDLADPARDRQHVLNRVIGQLITATNDEII